MGSDLTWFDWSGDRGMSADGKLLLFDESGEGGGASGGVYLRGTDGSPAVRLGDGVAIALSPDSEWAMTRIVSDPAAVRPRAREGRPTEDLSTDGLGFTHARRLFSGRLEGRLPRQRQGQGDAPLGSGSVRRRAEADQRGRDLRLPDLRVAGFPLDRGERPGYSGLSVSGAPGVRPLRSRPRGPETFRPAGPRTERASTSPSAPSRAPSISSTSRPAAAPTCGISSAAIDSSRRRPSSVPAPRRHSDGRTHALAAYA